MRYGPRCGQPLASGVKARQLGMSRPALYNMIDSCPRTRQAADLTREEIERAAACCCDWITGMIEILEVSEDGLKRQTKKLGLQLPGSSNPARNG